MFFGLGGLQSCALDLKINQTKKTDIPVGPLRVGLPAPAPLMRYRARTRDAVTFYLTTIPNVQQGGP